MRTTLIALILLTLAAPAIGQGDKATLERQLQSKQKMEKAQTVLRELTQVDYKAKIDIPTSDSLFVNDGKLSEAMYNAAMSNATTRGGKIAVKAGQTTKVSRVELLDFAVEVYFSDDSCALIGMPANQIQTSGVGAAELVDLAKKTVAAAFETVKK